MRNVEYKVGRDGYYTTCRTLASAKAQAECDPKYTIEVVLVNAEKPTPERSPMRKAMLNQFGRVSPSLKEKVAL